MSECSSCNDGSAPVLWRDSRWCIDCFKRETERRDADEDWVRRVIGKTAKPTFDPPVAATTLGYDSRVDLLEEHTILDRELSEVRTLQERGLSVGEIADHLEIEESTVEDCTGKIDGQLRRARQTIQMLEKDVG